MSKAPPKCFESLVYALDWQCLYLDYLTENPVALKGDKGPTFFDLLAQMGGEAVDAADLLQKIIATKGDKRAALRDRLHDVEHRADELNHTFIQKINQSFITPFDREDMSTLVGMLDDCVDHIDEAGDLIVLYKLDDMPPNFVDHLARQAEVIAKCSALTAEAMPKLKKPMDLKPYWLEINILENQGDKAYRRALADLFESGLDAVSIIKLKDIIALMEKSIDAFEHVAHNVETIAVKES